MGETDADLQTIYIELLEEGSVCYRPTKAIKLDEGLFIVMPTPDYGSVDEVWLFEPGTVVRCGWETHYEGSVLSSVLVARHLG